MWQKSRCYTGSMTTPIPIVERLSDDELLTQVERAVTHERHATAHLIVLLTEVDARRLYLGQGCSSLFTYCTRVLRLSEHAAFGRIEAARAARRFPLILERLVDGSVNLTAIGLLARHLTVENHVEVLDAASHKSKSEVEHLVARLRPRADAPVVIRKLPETKCATPPPPTPSEAARGEGFASAVAPQSPRSQHRSEVKPLAPRALQDSVHARPRDARQLALCTEPVAPYDPGWRSGEDLRESAGVALRGRVQEKTGRREAPAVSGAASGCFSEHSGRCATRGVDA